MMTSEKPVREPPIIIPAPEPSPKRPATLIFIHGYNDRASSFNRDPPNRKSIAFHLHNSPALKHLKIIVPEALPCIHKSVPGYVWYNIPQDFPNPGDPESFKKSFELRDGYGVGNNVDDMKTTMDYFEYLIRSEVASGTPASRIVFMGYSQGAGMVTLFLLTRKLASQLGAVISHAGFPPTSIHTIVQMQRESGLIQGPWNKRTIFFMLHGKEDIFVQREITQIWRATLERFKERGNGIADMDWRLVDATRHAMTVNVWLHVRDFLEKVVPLTETRTSSKL